jgi:hypothetical protein
MKAAFTVSGEERKGETRELGTGRTGSIYVF